MKVKCIYSLLIVASVLLSTLSLHAQEKAFVFQVTNGMPTSKTVLRNGAIPGNGTISNVTIDAPTFFYLYKGIPVAGGEVSGSTGNEGDTASQKLSDPATNKLSECFISTVDFDVAAKSDGGAKDVENSKRFTSGQFYTVRYNYLQGDILPTTPGVFPTVSLYCKQYKVTDPYTGLADLDNIDGDLINTFTFGPYSAALASSPYKLLPSHPAIGLTPGVDDGKVGLEVWIMKANNATNDTISAFQATIFPVTTADVYDNQGQPFPKIFKGDKASLPELNVVVKNLYPENYSEVRIFKAGAKIADIPVFRNSYTDTTYATPFTDPEINVQKNFSTPEELADASKHLEQYAKDSLDFISSTTFSIPLVDYISTSGEYVIELWTHTPNNGATGGWGWAKIPLVAFGDDPLVIDLQVKLENMNIISQ